MNANELTNILKKHGITASGKKKKLVKLALENVTSLDLHVFLLMFLFAFSIAIGLLHILYGPKICTLSYVSVAFIYIEL